MAFARLTAQDASNTGTTTATATYPGPTTAGHTLIAHGFTNSATAVLAIAGWTKQIIAGGDGLSPSQTVSQFSKIADGTETTVQVTGGNTATRIIISEYPVTTNPIVLDGTPVAARAASAGTTFTSGIVSTGSGFTLLVATHCEGTGISAINMTAPFTLGATTAGITLFFSEAIVSTIGNYSSTATWTTSSQMRIGLAGYQIMSVVGLPNNYKFVSSGDGISVTEKIR